MNNNCYSNYPFSRLFADGNYVAMPLNEPFETQDNKHLVGKQEQEVLLLQHADRDIGIYACYIPFPLGNDNWQCILQAIKYPVTSFLN